MLGVEMGLKEAEGLKAEAGDWPTGMFGVYGPPLSPSSLMIWIFSRSRKREGMLSFYMGNLNARGEFRKEKNADVFLVARVG